MEEHKEMEKLFPSDTKLAKQPQYNLLGDKEAESYASSTSMFASMTTYKKKKKNPNKHFFFLHLATLNNVCKCVQ